MLLHDYLKLKSGIIADAQAKVKNLLTEISDPKTRAAVDSWNPGDAITDNYPQVDQAKEEPKATTLEVGGRHNAEPPVIPPIVAEPTTPAPDVAAENTNHTT